MRLTFLSFGTLLMGSRFFTIVAGAKAIGGNLEKMNKVHHTTVALIPPPGEVFDTLMKTRLLLDDVGYYRWPPHVNLLYPYIENKGHQFQDSAEALALALSNIQPFEVELSKFDVFGGNNRGVLWLKPTAVINDDGEGALDQMKRLQAACESAVPICTDQRLKGREKGYIAHMTITHYESIEEARETAARLQESWEPLRFTVNEVCMMERKGADGQFKIIYRIPLCGDEPIKEESGGKKIDGMPEKQPQWIIDKKKIRNEKKKGNNVRRSSLRMSRRPPDSPAIIEEKRRVRKLRRENALAEESEERKRDLSTNINTLESNAALTDDANYRDCGDIHDEEDSPTFLG